MSFFSPRPGYNTSIEASLLTALNNLAAGGAGTAIQKTTSTTFTNVSVGSGGSGTVTSVATNATLTGGPITVTGTLGLNLANANSWTGQQTFGTSAPIFSTITTGSILFAGTSGLLSQDNTNFFWDDTNDRLGIGTNSFTFGAITGKAIAIIDTTNIPGIRITSTGGAGELYVSASGTTTLDARSNNSISLVTNGTSGLIIGSTQLATFSSTVTAITFIASVGSTGTAFQSSATTSTSNLWAVASGSNNSATIGLQLLGSTNVLLRVAINGTNGITVSNNSSYGSLILGSGGTTTIGSTGTHTVFAALAIKPLTIGAGTGATLTNSATLYIEGAATGGSNNYAILVNAGNTLLGGTLNVTGHVTLEGITSTGATGTGAFVFATSPTFITPLLGTPTSGILTNCTGLPVASILAGTFGTGAYIMDTRLTVPQILNADNAITASTNAATVTRANRNNVVTNNSAATLTITMSTSGGTGGDMLLVQIIDFSAIAQTLTWVNTENSTVSVPTTSNGSTTLPLTIGFKWNALTSKWRCIAVA